MEIFGRDESFRLLEEATAAARAGRGALVVVRADPGMGITALLDAHCAAARDSGMRTHRLPVLVPSGRTPLSTGPVSWDEPALVVLDDLHRADDDTLLALHELAEQVGDRSLLILAGRHRGATPERFAVLDRSATTHDLEPLDAAAVRAMTGAEVAEAGGNPWLLSRLTAPDRAAQVTGWATGLAGDDAGVLRYAALLGERASVDELASVAECSPAEVLAAIRRLAALGLVDEVDGRVSVRYPLLRDDLVATSAGLRGTVARALASRDAAPEDVAAHLVHAPLDSRVVNWLAEHAERLAAEHPLLVVDLLTRAVDRLPPGHPERHRIGASLAEAQLWSGRTEQARRSAGTGLVVRPDEQVRHRLRAVLAKIAIGEFDGAGAIEILDAEREEGKLPARLAVLDGLARFLIADLDGMQRAAEQAAPAAPHDPIVELSLLNFEAIALSFQRDFTGALAALDRAEALLSVAEDPLQRGWALFVRVVALDITQDIRVLDVLERGRPLAEQVGMGMLPLLRTGAAVIAYNFGRWDDSLAEIRAAAELPDLYGLGGPQHAIAALILLQRGDLPAAQLHIELAEKDLGGPLRHLYDSLINCARAIIAEAVGDIDKALGLVRNLVEGSDVWDRDDPAMTPVAAPLVRIALAGGDRELAQVLLDQLRNFQTDESDEPYSAVLYCQGLIDGDVDLLLGAAKNLADAGLPMAAANAAEDAAVALAASGKTAEAKAADQIAIDHYANLAADREINRSGAALRSYGVRRGATGSRDRPKHGWGSLTAAELRVAELVAQGLTNREVAERLVVSVRTVDSHVARARTKLGCASRVELAVKFGEWVKEGRE